MIAEIEAFFRACAQEYTLNIKILTCVLIHRVHVYTHHERVTQYQIIGKITLKFLMSWQSNGKCVVWQQFLFIKLGKD